MYSIDTCIINFFKSYETPFIPKDWKVALVTEDLRSHIEEPKKCLYYRLRQEGYKKTVIYTNKNPFIVQRDWKKHDLFIGVRPCKSEDLLLYLHWLEKNIILLPCNCNDVNKTTAELIRKYPRLNLYADRGDDAHVWYMLYDIKSHT